MGWVLDSGDRRAVNDSGGRCTVDPLAGAVLEKAFYTLKDFTGRSRRMYDPTKLAAVPHAMSKPASELLHFAYTIGQVGSINLPIVAHQ
jgi:hypothetical protein